MTSFSEAVLHRPLNNEAIKQQETFLNLETPNIILLQ